MEELRIKHQWIPHIIIAFFVLALLGLVSWAFYLRADAPEPDETTYIITAFVTVIGILMLFFIVRMLVKRPLLFYLDEKGFEYNPGGVSSGFIQWEQVQDIRKIPLRTTHGQLNGAVWETAIAIRLRDPSTYELHASPLLRPLLKANKNMYDADLFIKPSDLGKQQRVAEELLSRYGNHGKPILEEPS